MKDFLDSLEARYQDHHYLQSDPLEYPHRYSDPWDQEAVALVAALLAYGNARQVRKSVASFLDRVHSVALGPADFVRKLGPITRELEFEAGAQAFDGFVHRFNTGKDLVLLLRLLAWSWESYGSLGAHFVSHLSLDDRDIGAALSGLIEDWNRESKKARRKNASFSYFLTSPQDGSCCKRWCMFLKWVVRPGGEKSLDLGLWREGGILQTQTFPKGKFVYPRQLIMPLDTHVGRIGQYIGLTQRKSMNWLVAKEVTESLKRFDPDDPTRYDFAISRLGILKLCQKRFRREICMGCDLVTACRHAQRNLKKEKRA